MQPVGTRFTHQQIFAIPIQLLLMATAGVVSEQEVMYTLFNLAQFLGYVEVVRREGPREDAFLQAGNPQGSDTLATLVEGLRFVMSAASGNLVVSGQDCHHPSNKQ